MAPFLMGYLPAIDGVTSALAVQDPCSYLRRQRYIAFPVIRTHVMHVPNFDDLLFGNDGKHSTSVCGVGVVY